MRTSPLNHETTSAPVNSRRAFCVETLARAWVESLPHAGVTVPVLVSLTPDTLVSLVTRAITSRVTLDEVIHAAVAGKESKPPVDCWEKCDELAEIARLDTRKRIRGKRVQCLKCGQDIPRPSAEVE